MRSIRRTKQFKKDVRRAEKRGKDFTELKRVIEMLVNGEPLEERHRDHALVGEWVGMRDCHIEPDWLLLYQIDENELVLIRTGTHTPICSRSRLRRGHVCESIAPDDAARRYQCTRSASAWARRPSDRGRDPHT